MNQPDSQVIEKKEFSPEEQPGLRALQAAELDDVTGGRRPREPVEPNTPKRPQ